jgi:hypothetical protein
MSSLSVSQLIAAGERAQKRPSKAKKAVAARKQVKEAVADAVIYGLLSPEKAPDLIELSVKAQTAPKLLLN